MEFSKRTKKDRKRKEDRTSAGITRKGETSYESLKLFIGILVGIAIPMFGYPMILDAIENTEAPTEVIKVNDNYIPKVSGERSVTINGHFKDEIDYEILIRFRIPSLEAYKISKDLKKYREIDVSDSFITLAKVINETSMGISSIESGEIFKSSALKLIKTHLESQGVEVIGVTYNIIEKNEN